MKRRLGFLSPTADASRDGSAIRGFLASPAGRGASSAGLASPHRLGLLALSGFLAAAVVAIGAAVALAALDKVDEFGGLGGGDGQFRDPYGVAVRQATGDVFVVDSNNHRIQVFDPGGSFKYSFRNASGSFQDSLVSPGSIAIDEANKAIYISEWHDATINKYDLSTEPPAFETSWHPAGLSKRDAWQPDILEVDAAGNVYMANAGSGEIVKFDPSGTVLGSFGGSELSRPLGLALDSAGDLYVADRNNGLLKFDPGSGSLLATIVSGFANPIAAVTDAADNVYWFKDVAGDRKVVKTSPAGVELESIGLGEFGSGKHGIGLNDAANVLYATDGPSRSVKIFADLTPGPPTVASFSADVFGGTVTLNALVTPSNSPVTDCHFEWGSTASYGNVVPCDPMPGGGALPVAVEGQLTGLAESSTYHWRIVATNGLDTTTGADQQFTTPNLPTASIDPVTNIDAASATFSGTINPEAIPSSYQFEYSDDGFATIQTIPTDPADVGAGTADVPVTENVTGLLPNTDYEVRLVAITDIGNAYSSPVSFSTPAVPPVVRRGLPTAQAESATLRAIVGPKRAETTYYFEWGPDSSLGNRAPVPDGNAGNGLTPVVASEQLTGLDAGTTIYYRVTAENEAGSVQGPMQWITTYKGLPDDRVYEMVSVPDKGGFEVGAGSGAYFDVASESGDVAAYISLGAFANPISAPFSSTYHAERGSDGWKTTNISPAVEPGGDLASQGVYQGISAGHSFGLVTGFALTSDAPVGVSNLFVRGLPDGDYTVATATMASRPGSIGPEPDPAYIPELVGFTADASHVFVETSHETALCCDGVQGAYETLPWTGQVRPVGMLPDRHQRVTIESPYGPGDAGGTFTLTFDGEETAPVSFDATKLDVQTALEALPNLEPGDVEVRVGPTNFALRPWYITFGEQFANSDTPRLAADGSGLNGADASVEVEDGLLAFTNSGGLSKTKVGAASNAQYDKADRRAISVDGTRVVWGPWSSNAAQEGQIFIRDTGSNPPRTFEPGISRDGAHATGEYPTDFWTADRDLNTVFFTSSGELTPDANTGGGAGSDLYRYDVQGDQLTDITALPGGDGARVLGVADASADASVVYFVAAGKLDPAAEEGKPNLYVWSDDATPAGSVQYIATLVDGLPDRNLWIPTGPRGSTATPDGQLLLFETAANLTGFDSGLTNDAYLFDASANPTDPDRLVCVSCDPRGGSHPSGTNGALAITDDGTRVFFTTGAPLHPRDRNGTEPDVYEYDVESGQLALLSPGTVSPGGEGTVLQDISADGDSVFFITYNRVLPQDIDEVGDLYVVRVGGGFPKDPPDDSCQGDECQGDPTPPPDEEGADGTATADGQGNLDADAQRCERLANRFQALKERFLRLRLAYHRTDDPVLKRRIARRARRVKQRAIQVRQAARECRSNL